ncbi:MAG: hypothetical protein EPN39_09310 [Chitinophagaceae bacterium]|nr:MAG: hypothetical protein EPN39_09310 [Chitinophagaceae bacterium]
MNTRADKTLENKSQASANSLLKQQSGSESTFLLVDNRPEAIAQRKLRGTNNNSHVQQLKAYQEIAKNSPQVKQLRAYQAMADSFISQSAQRKESIEEETLEGKFEPIREKIGIASNQPIQRYLIVGTDDLTRWYKEKWQSYTGQLDQEARTTADLNVLITQVAIQMVASLNSANPVENQMILDIKADAGGLLRRQITKWIEEKPGAAGASAKSHPVFGRKSQTRAYENFKDLAFALLGWVKAKPGRRQEKALANRAQTGDASDAIGYHLDSALIKIREWVNGHARSLQISADLGTPAPVAGHSWNIYQNYFNNVAGLGARTTLPARYLDVLNNPQNYDVREKTGILHDIMHYFMEKYSVDNTINLVDNVGGLSATVPDPTHASGMKREVYARPENTQIRDNQKDAQGLVKPEAMPGSLAVDPKIKVSKEEQHDSYKLARSKGLPMYGRHSFTAARMMRMVQQSGGTPTEISAIAWSIMSYWRNNYDHRSIPYHTLHEIMDFLPEFGGTYDVNNPHAGIDLFTNAGLIQSLHTSILAAPNKRDIDKLVATDTPVNNAAWFLSNHALWANADVMNFLSTTVLPDGDFMTLNRVHLQQFFNYNVHTRHLKTLIPVARRNYVDGRI